jgi:hypothetical protein
MRFAIRIDPVWRPLLLLGGATPENSYVEVTDERVTFAFGLLFLRTFPRSEVAGVESRHWPLLMGVGWRSDLRGTIGLIGSYEGVVEVRLAHRSRVWWVFPCDRICVSLEDPNGFMGALSQRPAPEGPAAMPTEGRQRPTGRRTRRPRPQQA